MIVDLRRAVSEARFATYLARAGNDEVQAWALYEWNLEVSTAFLVPLSVLEVTLRNRLYEAGARPFGRNWLSTSTTLGPADRAMVNDATSKLRARRPDASGVADPITGDAIVAELSFAFWVGLVATRYDANLWRRGLVTAFRGPIQRPVLHGDLDRLRTLRNRIAHHEHLLSRNLTADLERVYWITDRLSPTTATWLVARYDTALRDLIAKRP